MYTLRAADTQWQVRLQQMAQFLNIKAFVQPHRYCHGKMEWSGRHNRQTEE